MKQKLLLFTMAAILLASCASNKKVARAYEKGKTAGIQIANDKAYEKVHRAVDSVQMEKAIVVHDTVTKVVKVEAEKKPTDTPTKNYVFKADFKPENFIGYPELGGKFYRVSPIYIDSVAHYDQLTQKPFYKKTERSLTIYIPIDDYNAIKRKKGNVTIYASWMKLSDTEMLDFDSKKEGMLVLAGTNYTNVGVKIDFTPARLEKEQKTEPGDSKTKIDPKKVADLKDIGPCSNPPDCTLLWPKTLNLETCNCE